MPNATQRGNISRNKTKKYYEARGWQVQKAEQSTFFFFGGRPRIKKQDLFGADLLAMNGEEIVFIQVKTGKPQMAECRKEFAKYAFPPFVKKVVVCWVKVKNRWQIKIQEV